MKERIESMESAMDNVFALNNEDLASKLNITYNTIASWRYNYKHNAMSTEKKVEILTKMGYTLKQQSQWRKATK